QRLGCEGRPVHGRGRRRRRRRWSRRLRGSLDSGEQTRDAWPRRAYGQIGVLIARRRRRQSAELEAFEARGLRPQPHHRAVEVAHPQAVRVEVNTPWVEVFRVALRAGIDGGLVARLDLNDAVFGAGVARPKSEDPTTVGIAAQVAVAPVSLQRREGQPARILIRRPLRGAAPRGVDTPEETDAAL